MELSERDLRMAAAALRIAADQYRIDANSMVDLPGHDRLIDQFRTQSRDALALADRITAKIG